MKFALVYFLLIFTFLLPISGLKASHMVGGGFSYRYVSENKYIIILDYYKDCSASAIDYPPGNILVGIYRKSDNSLAKKFELVPGPISNVNFLLNDCANSPVTCVQKRIYSDTLLLDTTIYNDAAGYYLTYEQCCRNFGIKNVLDPDKSGIAFYADFIPFTNNNSTLHNSSPVLKHEQSVYLCLFEIFTADYSHIDPDGDSLAYKLIDPLMGNTDPVFNNSNGVSITNPKPYPPINWAATYGLNSNIMNGNPDLSMDPVTGIVSIKPFQTGMYSFAYVVEEYRNGVLIASYNREVQNYIILCPARKRPNITWLNPQEINLKADSTTCLFFEAVDLNPNDTLTLFLEHLSSLIDSNAISIEIDSSIHDKLKFEICIALACNAKSNTTESIRLIVNDNSCPFFLSDSLKIDFNIIEKINQNPVIRWLNPTDNIIKANTNHCLDFIAEDPDVLDNLILNIKQKSTQLSAQSFLITIDSTQKNNLQIRVCIDADCQLLDNNTEGFQLFVMDNACPEIKVDSIWVGLVTEALVDNDPFKNIPNVFSPNGDGINDFFSIHKGLSASCFDEFEINVYNRWGEKVYNSNNFEFEWSGGGLPYGVYFYVINIDKKVKLGYISILY